MLRAVLLPPFETGIMWSYSRFFRLPHFTHLPPSRRQTSRRTSDGIAARLSLTSLVSSAANDGCTTGGTCCSGTEIIVSNPQCGHSAVRVSPFSKSRASNSIPFSQYRQRQVTKCGWFADMPIRKSVANLNPPFKNYHRPAERGDRYAASMIFVYGGGGGGMVPVESAEVRSRIHSQSW